MRAYTGGKIRHLATVNAEKSPGGEKLNKQRKKGKNTETLNRENILLLLERIS